MDVRVRCCGLGPNAYAADGSHIGKTVVMNYLESPDYRLSVDGKLTLGYLTHRGRSLDCLPNSIGNGGIKKVIGRDDAGLCVGENLPTFTHYVKEFYIEDVPGEGPWLMALVHIFDEDGFDDIAVQNIRRLKALIRNNVNLTCSLCVLAYWEANNGIDECQKIKMIKSLDFTMNPSFGPLARITEVIDDKNIKDDLQKTFSDISEDTDFIKSQPKSGELKVKVFSDFNSFGVADLPKTSKVNGKFTEFKIKEFSSVNPYVVVNETVQKDFSVATINERVRYAKLSSRVRIRRLFLEYRQALKTAGGIEKIDPKTLKILKSLYQSDMLDIMKTITPEVMNGKQINTLLGCSSLGKGPRTAAQKLQLPYRMAFLEMKKRGSLTPMRQQKLMAAYKEFVEAMCESCFGSEPIPEEALSENEEGGTK